MKTYRIDFKNGKWWTIESEMSIGSLWMELRTVRDFVLLGGGVLARDSIMSIIEVGE